VDPGAASVQHTIEKAPAMTLACMRNGILECSVVASGRANREAMALSERGTDLKLVLTKSKGSKHRGRSSYLRWMGKSNLNLRSDYLIFYLVIPSLRIF